MNSFLSIEVYTTAHRSPEKRSGWRAAHANRSFLWLQRSALQRLAGTLRPVWDVERPRKRSTAEQWNEPSLLSWKLRSFQESRLY